MTTKKPILSFTVHKVLAGLALLSLCIGQSQASSSEFPLVEIEFSQDEASLQRGALIYYKMCRVCHEMKYIHYKNFVDIGFPKSRVDEIRGNQQMNAKLDKTIDDKILTEYYGQVPPDLSVMAKARKHGPQYIYTLLTSYTYSVNDNTYDNHLFKGIKMPDVLNISTAIEESHKEQIKRDAKDVTEYLLWASDPHAAERKTTGVYVVLYFVLLSILLYLVMKRVWGRLDTV